jgi:dolichol-phosphate mannosyltransferase
MSLISIIIPVYNEEACLKLLADRLFALKSQTDQYEYIFVDESLEILRELAQNYSNVSYISFSRNFGHELATTAGLDHASGDAAVIIDADLQDPPEVIPELIEKWRDGNQIVYAQRRHRKGETFFVKFTSWFFYRILEKLSSVKIPIDTGDFRLMDRCVVDQFVRCREKNRFVCGLVAWTGFKQAGVIYDRDERHGGKTKYSFLKRSLLAFDAILGFSTLPLRIALILGIIVCVFSLLMLGWILIQKLFWGIPIEGYALLTGGIFLLGGVQLMMMGVIGEYVGRVYQQAQQRPLYIIAENSKGLPQGAAEDGFKGSATMTRQSFAPKQRQRRRQ